ncbi:MAG: carboxymuconolactone decarboxylase family protein [Spirochaetales bacterium]|nr:carboxymuconolactone decarboxylase family protein [Spirochaetales bacterium]
MPYINPPHRIPLLLRIGVRIAEKVTGKRMEPARILSWYPKAAIGAGVLESLVAHKEPGVPRRLLQLIRMQVSFSASCPFCIDMNSSEFSMHGITREEIEVLQGKRRMTEVESLTERERTALKFAGELTATPISIRPDTLEKMKTLFDERQYVIVASTIAQVNFWTRCIQSFGIPPAGFSETCDYLELDKYRTLKSRQENNTGLDEC